MDLKNRDFIGLMDFTREELEGIIQLAEDIKSGKKNMADQLAGKYIGLLFSVASTRTRISFQVGAKQMGGQAEFLSSKDLQLVYHESLIDTAAVMNRYLDGLVVRMYDMTQYGKGREALEVLADYADIPLINALDDKDHPCQVMGDILTLKEKFGEDYKKKKLVFSWGYSFRQKSPGVPHSMMVAGSLLGMNMTFAYPEGFDMDEEYVAFARDNVQASGGSFDVCHDLDEAVEDADVIYVKSWKGLYLDSEEEKKRREKIKDKWCVTADHFKRANPGAVFMNCLPIIRGEQATADVIDGDQSIIYDEAENRLHIQKAIMAAVI